MPTRSRSSRSTTIELVGHTRRYIWPDAAINIWVIVMLATAGTLIGIFASFINVQKHFQAGVPWLFPFGITVGALTVLYILLILVLIGRRLVLPIIIFILSFVLFALYLTGIIETAIQLFGPNGNVNSNCQAYVLGQSVNGRSINTLAWLEQQNICQSWYAAFAMWIVGAFFLVWICVIAGTVSQATDD